ncbi:MAG TPA: hypothetical protein VMX74_09455 [Pirellulales bacterium]|nr:hypothetical protein [Pirellulales bacterium]
MPEETPSPPWGRIVGLLTACLVTLIGVLSGLAPDLILQRALISSVIAGFGAAFVALLLEVAAKKT